MSLNLKLVKESMFYIGQDPDLFSDIFYDHFFENNPEVEKIFRNTDLRIQKLELIKGFLMIFSLIENTKKLTNYLKDLGARHVCYEIESHHYDRVRESLLYAIASIHEEHWNEEFAREWEKISFLIINTMKSGSEGIKAA